MGPGGCQGMLLQPRPRGRLLQGFQRGQDAPGGVQEGSGTRVPPGPPGGRRAVPRVAPGPGRSRGWRLAGGELSPGGISVLRSFGALL